MSDTRTEPDDEEFNAIIREAEALLPQLSGRRGKMKIKSLILMVLENSIIGSRLLISKRGLDSMRWVE